MIKKGYSEVSENIGQLKIIASDGKIAGEDRQKLELKSGKKLSTGANYLTKAKK